MANLDRRTLIKGAAGTAAAGAAAGGANIIGSQSATPGATPTGVDRSVPVLATHEISIDAPLTQVWALHIDVNHWPARQTDVTAARLDGPFEPGSSLTWTSFSFTVTSTIYQIENQVRVLWGGTSDGITGVHEWVFTETPTGTRVMTVESFAGAPVEADVTGMQRALDGSLTSWLQHLKTAAEALGA